ncbi:hypothetical protein BWI97_26785, partial [Siphonobacter sp. BAB-5405]|uniref:hypothetical protein n=1 Tax=Siphonobacter sp. BAB-5405 TaxID=1864825 RepID=UPI000CB0CFF7
IFIFNKLPSGKIEISNEHFILQNWRIDQVLTSEYFDLPSARPPRLDYYMKLREEILNDGKITEEIDLKLRQLENEWGVLPTGETRTEINALLLMKRITERFAND